MLKLVECHRDAMQGIKEFIPTELKIKYLNQLLKVGFDTLDFGSFVSAKAIPQLADTSEVLEELDISSSNTKLLAIIANERGAENTLEYEEITYLGFPFSISEAFQRKNTNASIAQALDRVNSIQSLLHNTNKELVVYISMAFGNPFKDEWNVEIVKSWTEKIAKLGVKTISLADTVGLAENKTIEYLFSELIPNFIDVEIGAHLHSKIDKVKEKTEIAFHAGCTRFDGAIKGFGGCPYADDILVGNMASEEIIGYFQQSGVNLNLDMNEFNKALEMSSEVFNKGI